jgi:alpha-tubulin suppressor-like RCC1 family protein
VLKSICVLVVFPQGVVMKSFTLVRKFVAFAGLIAVVAGGLVSVSLPAQAAETPVQVSVAIGERNICSLRYDSHVQCSGDNRFRMLGRVSPSSSNAPLLVLGLSGVKSVSSGTFDTCAVLFNGHIECWGRCDYGQVGSSAPCDSQGSLPVVVDGIDSATSVSVGEEANACAVLTSGQVMCWGFAFGQVLGTHAAVGVSYGGERQLPVLMDGLDSVTSVSVGLDDACAVLKSGEVKCWGFDGWGNLGDGSHFWGKTVRVPVSVKDIDSAVAVSVARSHSCVLLTSGLVKCFGWNGSPGLLGIGSTDVEFDVPVTVSGIDSAVSLSTSWGYSCAALASGKVKCWGYNWLGQLGNGSTDSTLVPVEVKGITDAKSVVVGNNDICVILRSDVVRCWGSNDYGQIGDGLGASSPSYYPLPSGNFFGTPQAPVAKFSTPVQTADGFTVTVTNYDPSFTFTPVISKGSGSVSVGTPVGSGLPVTVTGMTAGQSVSLRVTVSRDGYASKSSSVDGYPLFPGLTPKFSTPVRTADGFTVKVTNYSSASSFVPSITAGTGTVTAGTPVGSVLPLTVTGVAPGAFATLSVSTSRDHYSGRSAQVSGSALWAGLTPIVSAPVKTATGFTFTVTNYNPAYVFTAAVVSGSASVNAGRVSGSTKVFTASGMTPGSSATVQVTSTRAQYVNGTVSVTGQARP